MKRRVFIYAVTSVCLTLIVSGIINYVFFGRYQLDSAREHLREELAAIEALLAKTDVKAGFDKLAPALGHMRLTIFSPEYEVLADSQGSASGGNLPELENAGRFPYGEDIRVSEAGIESELFIARESREGMIIRLSIPMSRVYGGQGGELAAIIVSSLVVILVFLLVSSKVLPRIMRPLEVLGGMLRHTPEGYLPVKEEELEDYDDLRPIARDIGKIVARLDKRVGLIRSERAVVQRVVDLLDQGLILLDRNLKVISINDAARSMFGLPEGGERPESLLMVTHNTRIRSAIQQALAERSGVTMNLTDMLFYNGTLRLEIRPIPEGGGEEFEGLDIMALILITDITELIKTDQIRADFASNVSHELATPLHSIKKFTGLLQEAAGGDETAKRYLTMINLETDRELCLINDVMKLSEIQEIKPKYLETKTHVRPVAQRVIRQMEQLSNVLGVKVELEGGDGEIVMEPNRLEDMLFNMIENAIKYNKPGGNVRVSLTAEPGIYGITVRDTGIGIPKEHQERVFERFYRSGKEDGGSEGTGLGLAIVKHTALIHGGRIELESEPGEGTAVSVYFPAVQNGPEPDSEQN